MQKLLIPFLYVVIGLSAGVLVGCGGEATERESDCRADQYYDAAQQRCFLCPAVEQPQCREGCGFEIVEDERGCAVAQCAAACDLCPEGEVFSDETFECVED